MTSTVSRGKKRARILPLALQLVSQGNPNLKTKFLLIPFEQADKEVLQGVSLNEPSRSIIPPDNNSQVS